MLALFVFFFFFNDTATTEIYTLSLHDALPTCGPRSTDSPRPVDGRCTSCTRRRRASRTCSTDRKSTRLNSSHSSISYAVFCLKKKKNQVSYSLSYKIKYKNDK